MVLVGGGQKKQVVEVEAARGVVVDAMQEGGDGVGDSVRCRVGRAAVSQHLGADRAVVAPARRRRPLLALHPRLVALVPPARHFARGALSSA